MRKTYWSVPITQLLEAQGWHPQLLEAGWQATSMCWAAKNTLQEPHLLSIQHRRGQSATPITKLSKFVLCLCKLCVYAIGQNCLSNSNSIWMNGDWCHGPREEEGNGQ